MKMKKILTSLVLVGFLLVNVVPYTTHAVQFQGSDIQSIPPVILQENGNPVWKFYNQTAYNGGQSTAPSNGIVSFLCVAGLNEGKRECSSYILQLSALFILDKTKEIYETISYNIGGGYFKIYAQTTEEDQDYIFFTYETVSHLGVQVAKGPIAKIKKSENCGTQNPNICVVVFNPYLYLISSIGIEGVYMPFVDMIKYSDKNDNSVFYRKFLNGSSGAGFRDPISSLLGLFNSYRGNYGQFIMPLTPTYGMFYIDGTDNTTFTVLYETGLDRSFFKYHFGNYSNSKYMINQTTSSSKNAYYGSFLNYQTAWDLSQDNTYFMDFLTGKSDKLMYNFKDFFGVSQVGSEIVNPGSSANPDNWKADEEGFRNCELTEIGCHIGNLGTTIKNGVGGLFNGLIDGIKSIFGPIFKPIYDFIMNLIEEAKIIFEKLKTFFTEIYEIIKNLFKGGTDPTIAHNKLTPGGGFRASASQKLLCDKDFILVNRENIQKNEGVIEFVLTTLKAGFGIFAIFDPIAPTNGTELCTYEGIKTLHLRKNSFVDLIIFLTFSSMLMILFYKNS